MHKPNNKFILNENVKEHDNQNAINNKKNLKISNSAVTTNVDSVNFNQQQQSQLDIARENLLSQIIGLYSKGLTQSEIAEKMNVNQSTISRDLQYLQQEAKKNIWKYLNEDILFEYKIYCWEQ